MSKPSYEELEAQVKQLAAERDAVVAKEQEPVAYIIQDAEMRSRGNPGFLSYDGSISNEDINEYEISITPLYTHPTTDAFLASLRAEGVEMAAQELVALAERGKADAPMFAKHTYGAALFINSIAAQLRSQSAPSPRVAATPETAAIARMFEQVKGVQS